MFKTLNAAILQNSYYLLIGQIKLDNLNIFTTEMGRILQPSKKYQIQSTKYLLEVLLIIIYEKCF